ncbi:MAG: lamin tail domain-containing protein, partial [Paludibacteraceae bacterium]
MINELMPCNISTYRNGNNNYVGWIELYNDGADDVDIKGYTFKNLKKGGDEKWSWTVGHSCVIGADEYVLYYFDEITDQNFHAGYKIDSDGGSLILLSGTTEVSKVSYPIMYPHLSYG